MSRSFDFIKERAKQEASKIGKNTQHDAVISTAVVPALIAIWVGFVGYLWPISEILFVSVLSILILTLVFFSYRTVYATKAVQDLYFCAEESESEKNSALKTAENLEKQIAYFSFLSSYCLALLSMQPRFLLDPPRSIEEARKAIEEALSPVVSNCEKIFFMVPGELWNFAVYKHDDGKLIPIWRDKHRNHPSKDMGRTWSRGVGHVGKAFADKTVKLTDDATQHGIAEFMKPPPSLEKAYDKDVYKSYVCIPFGNETEAIDPTGVLVATSNIPGRFTATNHEVLRQAAVALGCLITAEMAIAQR